MMLLKEINRYRYEWKLDEIVGCNNIKWNKSMDWYEMENLLKKIVVLKNFWFLSRTK